MGRRLGKIRVSYRLMEDVLKGGDSKPMFAVFQNFIPTRCECMFHNGAFEYIGYSPGFDVIDLGAVVPLYNAEVTRDASGEYYVEFKRVD